jgi:hypothetical protein
MKVKGGLSTIVLDCVMLTGPSVVVVALISTSFLDAVTIIIVYVLFLLLLLKLRRSRK